jgi:hypothetical protein
MSEWKIQTPLSDIIYISQINYIQKTILILIILIHYQNLIILKIALNAVD